MACPFVHTIGKQHSVADSTTWNLEDDLTDLPDDALTLTHLNAAIQLLTAPSNENINQAVKSVIKKYSDRWPGIINLKIDSDSFSMYPNYDYLADIQDSIVGMDEAAASEILILIGEELIDTCCVGIIERAFRCLGGDLQEFLGSLDGVHDVLKLQEANISDTGFVCAGEGELIFTSERPVISWLLLGSLRQLAKILYGIEDAQITMEPIDGDVKRYRYLFDVGPSLGKRQLEEPIQLKARKRASVSTAAEDLKMNATTFCKAFPWHFVMNENLELLQLGHGFNRLFRQSLSLYGRHATTYFRFKRPRGLSLNFQEIRKHTHTPFLLAIRSQVCRRDSTMTGLEIKGQMVYCAETNTLLFIGSPFLDGLEGLTCNGLFISDIPLHDATREVILVGEQARAQDGLRRRMDKLKSSIEEGNAAVTKERKKNVSLLQLIFPAEIAESLWGGDTIEAKTHPDVTMLFSDIVGFTSICSRATPIMVINMLESLYRDFDEFCGFFDVYKVETIGDAYCVASGLHRASHYDAHKVAWMALRMLEACSNHNTHDGEHIQMRIGLHTGTVLAGVVGRKMPRYCLFGHHVTIANKFESGSVARKTNVSPTTKDWLVKYPGFKFELLERDPSCLPKEFPNAGNSTCYFLNGYKHPGVDDAEPLETHIKAAMKQINIECGRSMAEVESS
ncbi:head-specific guanylate cyclase [Phlebotomus papatasi]|uniref:head-specific guanylate cyclase n=1 Tax=Phlebotomus papatasi TaxID=29031 RepID=UPI0024841D3E|nr:head-specific guanylate cyclase [Phlebotomus papatasi]